MQAEDKWTLMYENGRSVNGKAELPIKQYPILTASKPLLVEKGLA